MHNKETDENNNKPRELYIEKSQSDQPKIITWMGIVMFAVCVQLGNHFTNWTTGLGAGFWSLIGIMIVILTSFGCEMLCIAEMTSALPFSGGTYGVVRVTLGDLPGYLLGTCEAFQYILYVAFTTTAMAKYITSMTEYEEKYEPLYWFIMYTVIAVLLTFRRTLFWKSMWVFGIYILVMLLLYCTMTREKANFNLYTKDPAVSDMSDNQQTYNFFQAMPHGGWLFNLSSKIMPLTCSETEHPTMNVPKAMYISYAISIVSAFAVVCCAVSISPGIGVLRMTTTPLIFGFSEIFDMTPLKALSFTLIAKFATCLSFAFAYSVLISSLFKSGFLGSISLLHSFTNSHSYLVGILFGSIMGFILNLVIWSWNKDFLIYLGRGYALLGFSVNLTIFVTYIVFKSKFSSLIKTYKSPVGIYGAIYGIMVFIIAFVSVGALDNPKDRWLMFVLLISFLLVWSAPYFLYYRHHLTYSEEESTIMFIAYVIRANQARRSQKFLTVKQRSKQLSPITTPRLRNSSSQIGFENTKPTSGTEKSARVNIDTTCGICNNNDATAVLVGVSNNTDMSASISMQSNNNKGTEVGINHSPPYYPPVQSSGKTTSMMSTFPVSRKPRSLLIELPSIPNTTHSTNVRENKIYPLNTAITTDIHSTSDVYTDEQVQNCDVSALDSVLTKRLRYDKETMERIHTEIQEFYEAQQCEENKEV